MHTDANYRGDTPSQPHRLTLKDTKVLGLSSLGGALEFYDFVIFVVFASIISKQFFPSDMPDWMSTVQTYGLIGAGYLARPLGGIIMAHFGDLLGRKRMFMLSILMMAIPTFAIGLVPTYETIGIAAPLILLLCRIFQGAAIGGEAPGAWVFVTEHVSKRHVGLACGALSAGLVAGILIGMLVAKGLNLLFDPQQLFDYGWRVAFILGGVFGFISMYLRRWLNETPIFKAMQARKELSQELPLKTVLQRYLPSVLISVAVTWVLTAGIMIAILIGPNFLEKLAEVDHAALQNAKIWAVFCTVIGCFITGALADRFGNALIMALFSIGLGVTFWVFYSSMLAGNTALMLPLFALTGLFVGLVGVVPTIAVKSFPPAIRFTGLSLSYNVAYALLGGPSPSIVAQLTLKDGITMMPAYYVAGVCAVGVLTSILLVCFRLRLDLTQRQPQTAA